MQNFLELNENLAFAQGRNISPQVSALPKISIVVPVYNEEPLLTLAVHDLHEGLQETGMSFELILCENGSTDETPDIANQLAEELDGVKVLSLGYADYGGAMKAGLKYSSAPYIIVFDIDYYDVGFLKDAIELLEDYDIVLASKLAPETEDKRRPLRKIITRGFALSIRTLFSVKVRDTHGIKAFKRDRIEPIVECTRLTKDLFDTELVIRAEQEGLKIKEIPVVVEEIRPARTSILRRIPRTITGLLKLRYIMWKENLTRN